MVAEAATTAEALVEARRTKPDVVVMDVRLPDGSGVDACRAIRSERPETRDMRRGLDETIEALARAAEEPAGTR